MKKVVSFASEGAELRGRLYVPAASNRPATMVIMAHGFSATIHGMVADRYAESFCDAGFSVLLYDHRNFGVSGGEPRREINKWVQARGYRDAMDFIANTLEVDVENIVLWGSSLSAAEGVAVASIDDRVKGVIAQVPAFGDEMPPEDPSGKMFLQIRDTFINGRVDGDPEKTIGPMPVVSFDPKTVPSLLLPMTAYRWFIEYGCRYGTQWENNATIAIPNVPAPLNPVYCMPHVKAALLMVVARDDEMEGASSFVAREAFNVAPGPKKLVEVDGGHFGILHYPSKEFELSSGEQVAFLREHFS